MRLTLTSFFILSLSVGCGDDKITDTGSASLTDGTDGGAENGGTSGGGTGTDTDGSGADDGGSDDGGSDDGGSDDGDSDDGGSDDGGSDDGGSDDGGDSSTGDAEVASDCTIDAGEWVQPGGGDLGGTPGIYDCGLFCVPEYITILGHEWAWVGDSMCDEDTVHVNLNCAEFGYDGGDCE